MKTFAIGIPTLNRADLLIPALMFYTNHDFPNIKIYIVDNGKQNISQKINNHPNVIVLEQEQNIGVAASWNLLCNAIFEHHEYALILNDDIYLGKRQAEIELLLTQYKFELASSSMDFCSFILSKSCYIKVGDFDEGFFPAYFEDNDYKYRAKLSGIKIWNIPFLNPQIFKSSQTLEKDGSIAKYHKINKDRYIQKWGGEPSQEKFKKPFTK